MISKDISFGIVDKYFWVFLLMNERKKKTSHTKLDKQNSLYCLYLFVLLWSQNILTLNRNPKPKKTDKQNQRSTSQIVYFLSISLFVSSIIPRISTSPDYNLPPTQGVRDLIWFVGNFIPNVLNCSIFRDQSVQLYVKLW